MLMHMNFVWQGHDSERKIGVSLKRSYDFSCEGLKKHQILFVFESRTNRLMFDDSCFDSFANEMEHGICYLLPKQSIP